MVIKQGPICMHPIVNTEMKIKRGIALIIVLFFFIGNVSSKITISDQANFSLITCAPGTEVYSLFGHSALRLQDESKGVDVVFNYGLFSFQSENFYWNFSRGYTDYLLGVQRYNDFIQEYVFEDRTVLQQQLNLTENQKQALLDLLLTNLEPENRIYRYNYFTNNCASKLRDILQDCAGNALNYYSPPTYKTTYRKVVRRYLKPYAWTWLGTDVCLGSPADKAITFWETMFLPDYLSEGFAKSQLNNSLLVKSSEKLNDGSDPVFNTPTLLRPFWVLMYLFLFFYVLGYLERKKGINLQYLDFGLYLFIGLAGIIISFFSFFSVHPTVYPNFNLLWAFPFHLLFSFSLLKNPNAQWKNKYRKVFAALLLIVIVLHSFQVQYFNYSLFPLFGIILLRSRFSFINVFYTFR